MEILYSAFEYISSRKRSSSSGYARKPEPFFFATTKAPRAYSDVKFPKDCFIVFGKESYGISETILKNNYDNCIRIPMKKETRSLNLAISVGIITFEALRQNNFMGLSDSGTLTGRIEKD